MFFLRRFVLVIVAALTSLAAGQAQAAFVLTNTESDIQADGIIDWSDLPLNTVITATSFTIDIKGTPFIATVSEPPFSDGFIVLENRINPSWSGDFAIGEKILFNRSDQAGNVGFDFSTPVRGFGFQIEPNLFSDATGTLEIFNNSGGSLGIFPFNASRPQSLGNDSATFVGVQGADQTIASALINLDTSGSFSISSPRVQVAFTGPTGETQGGALDPSLPTPNVDGAWEFNNVVGTGRWFDPPAATGYDYAVTDGVSKFTQVQLPIGIGDSDNQFVIDDPVNGMTVLAGGALHTFAVPVDMFTVTGIDPTVDGGDPLAYPTFLSFDQTSVSFTQTPVPEPASLGLFAVSLTVLASRRRKMTRL